MENQDFTFRPDMNSQRNSKTKKGFRALPDTVLEWVLFSNYSMSVFINGWREQLYRPLAVRITGAEFFFLSISILYLTYPKLKNNQDVTWFMIIIGFLFYWCNFYLTNLIGRKFKELRISSKFHKQKNELPSLMSAFFLFGNSFIIFLLLTTKELYDFHTRFFWWNK